MKRQLKAHAMEASSTGAAIGRLLDALCQATCSILPFKMHKHIFIAIHEQDERPGRSGSCSQLPQAHPGWTFSLSCSLTC